MASINIPVPSSGGGGGGSEPEVILEFTKATMRSVLSNLSITQFLNLIKDYTWVYFVSWVDDATNIYISPPPSMFNGSSSYDYTYNSPLYVPMFKAWYDFWKTDHPNHTISSLSATLLRIKDTNNTSTFAPGIVVGIKYDSGNVILECSASKNSWVDDDTKNCYILYGIK